MAAAATLTVVGIILGLSVGLTRHPVVAYSCPDEQDAQYVLTFFVIGDWGRQGNKNQRRAAKLMADIAECMPPSFVLSTGDNFYSHGLRSTNDPQFHDSFINVYDRASLQVPWYAVLGNHDYGDQIDPDAGTLKGGSASCAARRLEDCPKDCCYSATWQYTGQLNDARWHCQNGVYSVPTGSNGLVDIIMMDTNPFQTQYTSQSWYYNAGGIWQQDPDAIRSRLNSSLAASQAKWKFVVGHHPISSFGSHCNYGGEKDCRNLQWLEVELQNSSVAAYFCGHDHNLQYVYKYSDPDVTESPPTWPVYVVSGAGSDVRYGESDKYKPKAGYNRAYLEDDQGFVAVRVNSTHTVVYFYTAGHGEPHHTVTLAYPAQ
eukprot:GHUV01024314.1.p1 GENE.GHUV01024314.1~~GHUV01024314.1.p1  ORF type:complete len:373 (+),score=81.50 GHUV01024314.1:129-1247(+)